MSSDPHRDPESGAPQEGREEPLALFLSEGREVVRALAEAARSLEGPATSSASAWPTLAFLAHRLRGSAALFGTPAVETLAAAVEDAVAGLRRQPSGSRAVATGGEVLREAAGQLLAAFEALGQGPPARPAQPPTALLERLARLARGEAGAAAGDDSLARSLRTFAHEQADVLEFFGPEAREQAEGLSAAIADLAADLARGGDGRRPLEAARRLVHTLKGAAYMVGCQPIGDLCHAMEDLLTPLADGTLGTRSEVLRSLEDATDVLLRMLSLLGGANVAVGAPFEAAVKELRLLAGRQADGPAEERREELAEEGAQMPAPQTPAPQTRPAGPSIRVPLQRIDAVVDLVGETVVSRGRVERHQGRLAELEEILTSSRGRLARIAGEVERGAFGQPRGRLEAPSGGELLAGPWRPVGPTGAARDSSRLAHFAELEFDRYGSLDLLARQLAEISFDLGDVLEQLGALRFGLGHELAHLGKLQRGLRSATGRIRMQPFRPLFTRSRRQVERFARDHGRNVRFETRGEQVEVDAGIVERLGEALLHLVSNALIHGLENPAERLAAGKPEAATVALRADLRGALVEIEVEDDGRGMAAEPLRRHAVALGILSHEEAARLSDSEAVELAFAPGLSTAPAVTGEAGRGIGLDVVRNLVSELEGQIRTETLAGVGTRITLRLPVSRVVSMALGVRVGPETFALPTLHVRQLLTADRDEIERRDGQEWVAVEGEPVALVRLTREFGLPSIPATAGSLSSWAAQQALETLVVVRSAGRDLALVVDEILGIEEIVVQELGGFLAGLRGFSGVTVRPDGRAVLLLDPLDLPLAARQAIRRGGARPADLAPAARQLALATPEPRILVADDSISVRRVLGRRLAAAGYQVVGVPDGEQALEQLREGAFAALLTDLEMPRLDGFELLEILRRRPATRDLPILVLTTRAGAKHREQAMRLGASAYFSKPVDFEELLGVLRQLTAPVAARRIQGS